MTYKNPIPGIASVEFTNAVLWTYHLRKLCPAAKISYDAPSHLTEMLLSNQADTALIPIVDLFRNPSLETLGPIGLSADGDVTSVLLKCYRPISELRKVAIDANSHTSNLLAGIILKHHFGVDVEMVCAQDKEADAKVIIGDRALVSTPAPFGDYDLAGEWKKMTDLPFVFAVWACRKDFPDRHKTAQLLIDSLAMGFQDIELIAGEQALKLGITEARCRHYLENVIHYEFRERELESMTVLRKMIEEQKEI